MMVRIFTFLSRTIEAKRKRSSYRPFVQVPTKTWSRGIPANSSTGLTVSTRGGTAITGSIASRSNVYSWEYAQSGGSCTAVSWRYDRRYARVTSSA